MEGVYIAASDGTTTEYNINYQTPLFFFSGTSGERAYLFPLELLTFLKWSLAVELKARSAFGKVRNMKRVTRFERATCTLARCRSTTELYPQKLLTFR